MDYPTMLYLGGLDSHAIAHDEDEAEALKEKGYVEHDEAVKIKPDDKVTDGELLTDVGEQLGEAYEHIEMLEGAIEVKDKTINDLNGKLAAYEAVKDKNKNGKIDYEEMTNAELHKLLDERKADYNKRDGKDALIKAATDSE